jgi:Arc/MetJ family transcription regulator
LTISFVYTAGAGVTKRLVDIDDEELDAARKALNTSGIKETVTTALREAVAGAARRREIERLTAGALAPLADKQRRRQLWR